ncbi:SHOCT domain-containing protein [Haloarcula sediminis]|uniref:SHOCT domain-containing protein n=1 Tax=Haloarcula sediminis TaxID=3111777 RepID=UPI002D79135D|nr:SHOCT domain-containing protein [Haloarcula sp. CK38]
MTWLAENRHWLLFAATVLSGLSTAGVAVVGVLATASVLVTGGSLVLTVGAFLLATLLLGGLTLVFGAGLLSTLASRASLPSVPRNRRVANALHGLEAAVPPLRRLGLADRLEPTVEDRRARLTERYVDGELSEREFEARLDALLDETGESRVPDSELGTNAPAAPDREIERERER